MQVFENAVKGIYLSPGKARRFAETAWGRGGTKALKTTRKGVYYFSCSGHGGYVVDASRLSKEEYDAIRPFARPDNCLVVYLRNSGKVTFWQNPWSVSKQSYKIYQDSEKIYREVFFFEEDCAWSILEKFTNIRLKESSHKLSKKEYDAYVEEQFTHWFGDTIKIEVES